jgi:hypothetical protein
MLISGAAIEIHANNTSNTVKGVSITSFARYFAVPLSFYG